MPRPGSEDSPAAHQVRHAGHCARRSLWVCGEPVCGNPLRAEAVGPYARVLVIAVEGALAFAALAALASIAWSVGLAVAAAAVVAARLRTARVRTRSAAIAPTA